MARPSLHELERAWVDGNPGTLPESDESKVMNRKLLLVAGAAAATVALLVLHAWQQRLKAIYSPGPEIVVAVAAHDLQSGTQMLDRHIERRPYSQHLLAGIKDPIDTTLVDDIQGKTLVRPISRGEILRLADFETEFDSVSLAGIVKEGLRAVPLAVDEINAFSGLVQPGDRLDVLAYLPHPRTGRFIVKSLLENVRVLATGDRMTAGGGFGGGGTITLLLSREQAVRVSLAQRSGQLVFMLRHPTDGADQGALDELSIDDLVEPEVAPRPVVRPTPPVISVSGPSKG